MFSDVISCCIDEIPKHNALRVPKIQTIYGVVGMLKLLAGKFYVTVNSMKIVNE